ncbi:helix-turn-helix transcriptional regulator [Peristeroidobacter soli]|jgi:YesN/AraC family two-component response regulator|uniref:helix-turn-helix transcriptional regulator n=1 Tax=Peristeroidobacter soli TaxID=2497877 RepID=UPI00101B94CC|nr:response regulator transcription factor [Peristeroidobacter soli]
MLLWVDMCCGARVATSSAQFSRHCQVRPTDQHHLWTALSLGGDADVICFDVEHPDMSCLKFMADTKARFPSVPIIMLMSQQSADVVLWALRARIFDVLLKPLTPRDVLRCVERLSPVLEARRTQQTRANATGAEAIPDEARYHARRNSRGKLDTVLGYIEKNYAQPISEQDVAKECGLSPFEFSRAFRAAHGVTFRDYLAEWRLMQSKRLLGISQVSVSDVAAMAGFNDPSYFARLFRKRTGISPSAYRASLSSGAKVVDVEAIG